MPHSGFRIAGLPRPSMTYCLAIKVQEGLVCLSDGRITSGSQVTNAYKSSLHDSGTAKFAIMTSGLRSLRDKTLAYFERDMRRDHPEGYVSVLDAVDGFCRCLRAVAEEDREALAGSKLSFNLHTIVAGQLREDAAPDMYLVYPEGNWIQVDERTPYLSIGATTYGKPILDRALTSETPLRIALKLAYLSFDSTRTSSADVGFPLDMMSFARSDQQWRQVQFAQDDLHRERNWWNEHLTKLAQEMPDGPWLEPLLPGETGPHLSVVSDE